MLTSVDARPQAAQASHVALSVAAQNLFGGPSAPENAPVVILKRRRIAAPAENMETSLDAQVEARQPRVHLVARASSGDAGATPSLESITARVEAETEAPVVVPRRPRRRLNGKVRVLAVELIAGEIDRAPSAEVLDTPTGGSVRAVPTSFVGPGGRSYERLVAEIGKLQAKADNLKRQEAAAAVRWVRETIELYGLAARDLGL